MRLPFFHSTTSGLYITDTGVFWVSVTRFGSRLRSIEQAYEAVQDGDLQAALKQLVKRLSPSAPYVISHLDPLHVRYVIAQGPALDDTDSFEAWLAAEAARQRSSHATFSDVAVRVHLLDHGGEYTRCLFVLASRTAVEARVALLEAAGVQPLGISSIGMVSGDALRLHPAFAEGRSVVLFLRPEETTVLYYREGILQSVEILAMGVGRMDVVSLLQAVVVYLAPMPDRLFVLGTEAPEVIAQARDMTLVACDVLEGTLDLRPPKHAPPVPLDFVPAVALTLPGNIAASEMINFLEPETVARGLQDLEKREAMRTLLLLGGLVALFYVLQALATVYLNRKLTVAEMALNRLAGQIGHIEQHHKAVQQLERDVAQAEQLAGQGTYVAGMLAQVAKGVPEGLWLEAVDLEETTGGVRLTLLGVAYRGGTVAIYLERLEQVPFAANVQLLYAEAIRAAMLYTRTPMEDRPLARFQIQLTATTLFPSIEAAK